MKTQETELIFDPVERLSERTIASAGTSLMMLGASWLASSPYPVSCVCLGSIWRMTLKAGRK